MKIDYEYKSAILQSNLYKEYIEINKALYNHSYNNNLSCKYTDVEQAYEAFDKIFLQNYKDYIECKKINKAFINRKLRLKDRIVNMLSKGTCIFCTFTFNDEVFNNTTSITRRRYIARFLKSISNDYVANQDFGSKFGREHYHAIVLVDNIDINSYKYGYCYYERCDNNSAALSNYISKLTNHAIKNTNKRSVLIYSK